MNIRHFHIGTKLGLIILIWDDRLNFNYIVVTLTYLNWSDEVSLRPWSMFILKILGLIPQYQFRWANLTLKKYIVVTFFLRLLLLKFSCYKHIPILISNLIVLINNLKFMATYLIIIIFKEKFELVMYYSLQPFI